MFKFNFIERFIIRKAAKKFVKHLPELKLKGIEIIEKHTDELLQKVKEAIIDFIKSH